jgi:hypothetical protein
MEIPGQAAETARRLSVLLCAYPGSGVRRHCAVEPRAREGLCVVAGIYSVQSSIVVMAILRVGHGTQVCPCVRLEGFSCCGRSVPASVSFGKRKRNKLWGGNRRAKPSTLEASDDAALCTPPSTSGRGLYPRCGLNSRGQPTRNLLMETFSTVQSIGGLTRIVAQVQANLGNHRLCV